MSTEAVRQPRTAFFIPRLFLTAGLVLGLTYVFLTPPLRVPDESSHFYRAYTAAHGSCIGTPAIMAPVDWREMYTKRIWTELPSNTTPEQMAALMLPPRNLDYGVAGAFVVANAYNCLPYIPASVGILAARPFSDSSLVLMYAGRIANLMFYLTAIYIALQLLPALKLVMATIALMPMALYLAASFSADNAAIALSFLFVALFLRLRSSGSVLTAGELVALTILVAALAGGKTLMYPVLLVLLPAANFGSEKRRWLWIGAWAATAAGTLLCWQWMNRVNAARLVAVHGEQGILMSSNLHWILTHPFSFLEMAGRTLWIMRNEYLSEFVGKLGWLSIPLPTWLIWTFIGTLILVAASSAKFELGVRLRLLFVLLGVVSVIAGFVWVWTLDTQTARIESLRTIAGFQGRYLIPAAFPLLAAISGSWLRASRSWAAPIALFVVLLANGIALRAVGRTYYSEASSNAYDGSPLSRFWLARFEVHGKPTKYEHKLIRRPGPTAEDGKVYFVSNGLKRWVLHAEWMAANGFTWGDVLVLPSEELNAIPTGQPIGWP